MARQRFSVGDPVLIRHRRRDPWYAEDVERGWAFLLADLGTRDDDGRRAILSSLIPSIDIRDYARRVRA